MFSTCTHWGHPGEGRVHADVALVPRERPEDDPPLHGLRDAVVTLLDPLERDVLGDYLGRDVQESVRPARTGGCAILEVYGADSRTAQPLSTTRHHSLTLAPPALYCVALRRRAPPPAALPAAVQLGRQCNVAFSNNFTVYVCTVFTIYTTLLHLTKYY